MKARTIDRIEANVQLAAAALFAAAAGYAVYELSGGRLFQLPCAIGAAVVAYALAYRGQKQVGRTGSRLKVPVFDLREFDSLGDELLLTERVRDELLLTDADRVVDELVLADKDRLANHVGQASEPLVLDDVLAAVGEESRVVRLFDRKAMPTPGQLSSTIDRHLEDSRAPTNDAAQALSDALAELRRSLR